MESTISATELARTLSDILSRVRYREEKFVIERNGEGVAMLVPLAPVGGGTLRQVIEILREVPPDDGFADDLESVQASQEPLNSPRWS